MSPGEGIQGRRAVIGLGLWLGLTFAAAAIGGVFMPGEWYAGLKKPSWNPPNGLFGPVWTVLYLSMAVAAWLVWRQGGFRRQRVPLTLFVVQLGLNALWTPLFFGLQRPDLAFAEILALWGVLLGTLLTFWKVKTLAGVLLVPYLAWVSFASVLNFALWRLNRGA